MDLNLMAAQDFRAHRFSAVEIVVTVLPLIVIAAAIAVSQMPEISIFAQCQNIPGGDICSITLLE